LRFLVIQRQLRRVDFADVTQKMRGNVSVNIGTLDFLGHLYAGHRDLPGFDRGDLVARKISFDFNRHKRRLVPSLVQNVADVFFGHLDQLCEQGHDLLCLFGLVEILGNDFEIERRPIVDEQRSVAVKDHSLGDAILTRLIWFSSEICRSLSP